MIQYSISEADLEEVIEEEQPGWLRRAQARTAGFVAAGRYDEPNSIWGEIKVVYMRLQGHSKCAYCERKLESEDHGRREQDVEHFRPKGNVKEWPVPTALAAAGVTFDPVPNPASGYYALAYHPYNYASACKPCNGGLKRDYFPVASPYNLAGTSPAGLLAEQPYLIYPIGSFDDDPEDLIGFIGISPYAKQDAGHARNRALVTIDFFRLDDVSRKNLVRERAMIIVTLYALLANLTDGGDANIEITAPDVIRGFTANTAPHANCARSYVKLFAENREDATRLYRGAVDYIESVS